GSAGAWENGSHAATSTNGHATLAQAVEEDDEDDDDAQAPMTNTITEPTLIPEVVDVPAPVAVAPASLKDAFVRQLQLDRLTLRQMRSLLMSDEARRAIEVAVGATEATYERLALILFGIDLPQLLGKNVSVPTAQVMPAEERWERRREKAPTRARLRRAAIKAAKQSIA